MSRLAILGWSAAADVAGAAASGMKTVGAAVAGPVVINLLGYDLPVLSAIVAVAGVILARLLARRNVSGGTPLPVAYEVALVALLCLVVLACVIAAQTGPIITIGWAIGLGWSGVTVIESIGRTGRIDPNNPVEPAKDATDE